ncbi:hypothetical protein J4401_00680 [Candidatus Woesearchaeota archaeon]|nr:hypothetical protein [Candidatus Woesearchaeota archaeon]
MKLRKTIKRIVALGLGSTMVGATMFGATALADLNDYPSPFIKDGKFTGALVVGDLASAQDVLGVSDIAAGLQFAAKIKAGTGATTSVSVEGDAFRVSESGNALNLYQNLSVVSSVLDDADLTALADGKFRAKSSVDYTQTLTMPTASVGFTTDPDVSPEDPALYLTFQNAVRAINYKLSFTTSATSDWDGTKLKDFEDEQITMLGNTYTITKAVNASGNMKLTLMSGAYQDTLEVGQTKTYTLNGKEYVVTNDIVSGDTSATSITKFTVNDESTSSLSNDETYTLKDGIEIGIKEIFPTKAGDVKQNLVEFYLGAQKLVLDGQNARLEVGDESISDATVTITQSDSGSERKLSEIQIQWTPTDDYFVPVGGKLSEAVSDNKDYKLMFDKLGIDYQFSGLEASDTEMLKFTPSGKNYYKFEFTNRKGVKYDQRILYYNATAPGPHIGWGEDDNGADPLRFREGETVCKNDLFIVESNKNSRILRLSDVSPTDKVVTLKDLGTGDSNDYSYTDSSGFNVSSVVMDGATYTIDVSNPAGDCVRLSNIAADTGDTIADIWTQYDVKIGLNPVYGINSSTVIDQIAQGNWSGVFNVTEDLDGKEDSSTDIDELMFNVTYTAADGLDVSAINTTQNGVATIPTTGWGFGRSAFMIPMDSDDNQNQAYTPWGNKIVQKSTDNQDKWEITISKKEAVANVFVTAGATKVTSVDASGEAVFLNKIDVGATKLASEIVGKETTMNVILVGGPCANAAVEKTSADFPTCTGWTLTSGEALIQLVNHANGNVALLVAGTLAADTKAATSIVAESTKLKALADGVTKQLVTKVNGVDVLTNVVAPVVDAPVVPAVNVTQ